MKDKVSVIVPTYNERDNLPELVKRIDNALKEYEYEIVVVDDDSPDGTWKVALDLSKGYPVKLVRRKERGLSTAVLKGIEESNYDIIVGINADLQHPPEKIPELVEAIITGADIAIGSRFVDGGSVGNWSYVRLWTSKGANFLAKTLFRDIREVKDIQSGFYAFKKSVVNNVSLNPVGYKILLEILVMARDNYETVKEVPYVFQNRQRGKSKLGSRNIFNYLRHIFNLSWRTREILRFIKFNIVGAIGFIVSTSVLMLLTELRGIWYIYSTYVSLECGLLSNFIVNKVWTFKDRRLRGAKSITKALIKDHIIRVPWNLVLIPFIVWFLTDVVGMYYVLSFLIGIATGMIFKFIGNMWWTWE